MGYTLEEMVGINPMTLVHQEDLPKLADLFIEGVQSPGYTARTKCRMRHKNGTWRTLDLVASNLLTEPAVEGIVINSRDITDQELAEERIRQSEKNYRELFQVNKDGIAIFLLNPIGPPSTFVEINQAAHQMLGYSREEMLKLSPPMLEPFTTQEQMRSRQSVFNTREVCNFETILLHKNGRRVFAEFTAQMIQYDGRPAIMNIVRDITENKHHQDELRAISALSTALRTAETRAEMLPVIVEQLSVLLNCDSASIEIIDPDTGDSVVEEVMGAGRLLAGSLQKKAVGMNAVISQTRQPYFTNNLVEDSNFIYPDWARSTGIHAGAGVPLIARERLIGFVWMGRKTDITESEVSLLTSIGDIAANALYRATLHEQAKKDAADLAKAYDTTLEGWVNALELRDQETEGHTRRVIQMTVEIARLLGICENDLENVRRGALLHDIGKMGIPDSVLLKPGTLDDREWEIMRRHPEYAYQLLDRIEYLRPVLDIPYCHHERWDGTGYPRGLKGEEIPFGARIFAIVDVWDALTSNRPYRRAWEKEKALAHILEQSKKHFDPIVVEAFMKII